LKGSYGNGTYDILGMGSTSISDGVHLHYGIQLNGIYVDPLDYLKFPGGR